MPGRIYTRGRQSGEPRRVSRRSRAKKKPQTVCLSVVPLTVRCRALRGWRYWGPAGRPIYKAHGAPQHPLGPPFVHGSRVSPEYTNGSGAPLTHTLSCWCSSRELPFLLSATSSEASRGPPGGPLGGASLRARGPPWDAGGGRGALSKA